MISSKSTRMGRLFHQRHLPFPLMARILLLILLLSGFPKAVQAYEWIDYIQDKSSLQSTMETLRQPLSGLTQKDSAQLAGHLEKNWFLRKRYIAVGDRKVGVSLLEKLHEQMLDMGAIRLRPYSVSLLREAVAHSKQEEFEEAIRLCKAAMKFSPGLPDPHMALAKVYWMQNKINIFPVALEWLRALHSILKSFDYSILLMMKASILVLFALMVFFGGFFVIQLIRYYRLLMHDLYEKLPGEPHRYWIAGTTLICLFIPFLLGWGIYGLFLFWILLFWSYSNRKERVVHIFFLLFAALVPLWVGTVHRGMDLLYSERMQSFLRHQDGVSDDATLSVLIDLTHRDAKDDALFFMLGTAYKKRGEYGKAEEVLRKAVTLNPKEATYYNNLGNTYYAKKDLTRAIEMYNKAISLNAKRAAFYYNLSSSLREQFLLRKSDQEYFKARDLDPKLVSHYVDILGPSFNRMLMDEILSKRWVVNRYVRELFPQLNDAEKSVFFSWNNMKAWLIPLLFLAVLIPLHFLRTNLGLSYRCVKCGIIYCKQCQSEVRPDSVCSQCLYIFEEQSGVEVKERTRKIIQIRRFIDQRREFGRLLGILIPGGGHIYSGRVFSGFIILFLIMLFLGVGLFGSLLSLGPMSYGVPSWNNRIFMAVPVLIIYGLSIWHLYRIRR